MNPNSDPTHNFILLFVKYTESYNRRYDLAKAFYNLIRNPLAEANGNNPEYTAIFYFRCALANG